MKKTLVYLAIAAALAACHNSSSKLERKDQQPYDVVQEGQASGVTSTINAPGEVAPPPAPMTGTNADTTSNFTLPQVSTSGTQGMPPGTIAQTLPQNSGSMNTGYPTTTAMPPRPRTTTTATTTTQPPRPAPPRHTAPPPRTDTTYTVESAPPPPPTSTVEPNTDTAPPPPPSTDTTSTKKQKDKDNPPPTQTDTQPPPTTTT